MESELLEILCAAGWAPSRDMKANLPLWTSHLVREGFELSGAAEDALRQFGGLLLASHGPGKEVARSSVNLDPRRAEGELDRFAAFERILGKRLFPLGDIEDGHAFLACAGDHAVYMLMDDGWYVGRDIVEALRALLLGLKPVRMGASPLWDGAPPARHGP